VASIEKEGAGPDVDGLLVLRGEVVVQTGEEELLDLRVAIGDGGSIRSARHVAS
jgi:hypothetical protein